MVTAWYTLVVGVILTLNGVVFLIFSPDGFSFPKWYLGILVLIGAVGIILGLVKAIPKKKTEEVPPSRPNVDSE